MQRLLKQRFCLDISLYDVLEHVFRSWLQYWSNGGTVVEEGNARCEPNLIAAAKSLPNATRLSVEEKYDGIRFARSLQPNQPLNALKAVHSIRRTVPAIVCGAPHDREISQGGYRKDIP